MPLCGQLLQSIITSGTKSIFRCKDFLDFLDLTTCSAEKCTTITVTVVVMPDLITYMCTHSSPPNSDHSESEEASWATGAANSDLMTNVIWTQEDETALINFLIAHKSEAGDGVNFKPSVWTATAIHMQSPQRVVQSMLINARPSGEGYIPSRFDYTDF